MNLVWHLVRKDARRLVWPLGLWYALGLVHEILPSWFALDLLIDRDAFAQQAAMMVSLDVARQLLGLILAAWLVLEDPLVGMRATWLTRPIGGGRLLAAKLLGAGLFLLVGPLLLSFPFWLSAGFGAGEMAAIALESVAWQLPLLLGSMAVATVSASGGAYLIRSVALLSGLLVWILLIGRVAAGDAQAGERALMAIALVLMAAPTVLVWQYLTRRLARAWVMAGGFFLVATLLQLFWPWGIPDFLDNSSWARRAVRLDDPADAALRLELSDLKLAVPASQTTNRLHALTLRARLVGAREAQLLRISWAHGQLTSVSPGESPLGMAHFANRTEWRRQAVLEAMQVMKLPAPASFFPDSLLQGTLQSDADRQLQATPVVLRGKFHLQPMDVQVLGELPLQSGTRIDAGSSHTQLLAIERDAAGRIQLRLAETDARWFWKLRNAGLGNTRPYSNQWPAQDVFVLLNRKTGLVQVLDESVIGSTFVNGRFFGQRVLMIRPPVAGEGPRAREVAGWDDGAVVAKVRCVPMPGAIERTFESGPLVWNP